MIDALVEVRLVRLGLAHRHKLALGCAVVVDAVVAIDTRNTLGDAADNLKEQFSIIRLENVNVSFCYVSTPRVRRF